MNKFLTPLAIAAVSIAIVTSARAAEGGDLDCGSKYDHVTLQWWDHHVGEMTRFVITIDSENRAIPVYRLPTRMPIMRFDTKTRKLTLNSKRCKQEQNSKAAEEIPLPRPDPRKANAQVRTEQGE
jgi:hypothetical protein